MDPLLRPQHPLEHDDPDWARLAVDRELGKVFTSKVWREKIRILERARRSEESLLKYRYMTAILDAMQWFEDLIPAQARLQQEQRAKKERASRSPFAGREGIGG